MGELSSARQALEGAAVAPGTEETREALQDPGKRPQEPYEPLPARLRNLEPDTQFQLDEDKFARNVRSAKRGAAQGPSGMTTDHIRPFLKSHQDTQLMCKLAGRFAQGQVPDNIVAAVRLGGMTALVMPVGGVRGIVVGDVFRRLVARTVDQQVGLAVEKATAPFQYALSTRAGCECIGHAFQFLTERDPSATITSIDGISAFDTISRTAMMVHSRLLPSESLMAYLDDNHVVSSPERVEHVHTASEEELFQHCHIRVHAGKTRVWNVAGIRPDACDLLERLAAHHNSGPVWRGSEVHTHQQGVKILGTPLGHHDFVQTELELVATDHQVLLDRIPGVPDVQTAWLLLPHCAQARANYMLRMMSSFKDTTQSCFSVWATSSSKTCRIVGTRCGRGLDSH